MRFMRHFLLDIREGLMALLPLFAATFALQIVIAAVLQSTAVAYGFAPEGEAFPFSSGDYLAQAFGGIREYASDELSRMIFPIGWMLQLLLMFYLPLTYPYRNLSAFGKAMLIAGRSRWVWWLSKCFWVTACVALFWAAVIAGAVVSTAIFHGPFELSLHDCMTVFLNCDAMRLKQDPSLDILPFMIGAIGISIALCLLQLFLSLVLRPTLAYMTLAAIAFASVFVSTGFLPAEYLMAARSDCFIESGASLQCAIGYAALIACTSVAGGGLLFSRKDIIDKEFSQ